MYTNELVRIHEKRAPFLLSRLGAMDDSEVGGNVGSSDEGRWVGEYVGKAVDGVADGTNVGMLLFVGKCAGAGVGR